VKIALIAGAVLLLLGMGACSKYVDVRNDLVTQREAVTASWSGVDVALQRRADLIPNLVETVKGFAAHETEVFKNIGDARAALGGARTPAEKIAANDQVVRRAIAPSGDHRELSAASVETKTFCASRTNWPGPKTVSPWSAASTETLQRYNTFIELFPNNIVAGMSGFTRNDAYFKTEPGARTNPKVQF
jgi:LemA protein